jgi:hypothetical protein
MPLTTVPAQVFSPFDSFGGASYTCSSPKTGSSAAANKRAGAQLIG